MKQNKRELANMVIGGAVGLLAATAVAQIALPLLADKTVAAVAAAAPFGMVSGALVGVLAGYLCREFHRLEQCALVLLASIGLAALSVIAAPFAEGSAVPATLYGVALLNGVILGPTIRFVADRTASHSVGATS